MNCSLLDFGCHAKGLAVDWWFGLPWYLQVAIVVGILFMAWGMIERAIAGVRWLVSIIHRFGGWQAVVGAAIGAAVVVLSIVLTVLPRKPKADEPFDDEDPPLTRGPFQFGVDKKTRPKVGVRPRPKRKYNPNNNKWES